MAKRFLPSAPPKNVARTETPKHTAGEYPGWVQQENGAWLPLKEFMKQTQEELEMKRAYEDREPQLPVRGATAASAYQSHRPVNNQPSVVSTPKTYYTASANFKYGHWRRIEDKRILYSMSGIKLSDASSFKIELVKYLETDKEQIEALLQLLEATIEYGYLAPEPCTERWIHNENEYINLLQHCRIDLHNLFLEHNLLEHKEIKERQFIWEYLNTSAENVDQSLVLIEELMKEYTYGMFDPEKKVRYANGRYVSKKNKKKPLTKNNKQGKVKNSKEEKSHATVH